MYQAKFRMSSEAMPLAQTLHDKIFEALSEPGTTIWYGDWWIVCTSKVYNEVQYYPEHRPIWMTFGEWELLRSTIKNYRLAYALNDKPLFMSEEEWNNILEIKSRHGLLPDTNPQLSMDELEKKLDEESLITNVAGAIRMEYEDGRVIWFHPEEYQRMLDLQKKRIAEYPLTPSETISPEEKATIDAFLTKKLGPDWTRGGKGVMEQLPKDEYKKVDIKDIKLPGSQR
jgi:hypothetical protein